jgi:hypothetical protein
MEELIQERSSVKHYKNKANWMEYGEKCTKLSVNLQHRNAKKNVFFDSPNDIWEKECKVL